MQTMQAAYNESRIAPTGDVSADIVEAMRAYLVGDLGLSPGFAEARAGDELARRIPRSVVEFLSNVGVAVAEKSVLDLGAGLGGMSEELVLCGARVTAVEPGEAWAELTRRRLERRSGQFHVLRTVGESIPLPANSMDLVVSLQVLEHVSDPARVLAEVFRVLRPGGHFYLACENYLAFREAHYQVPWIPLLPKSIGSLYLRVLGRSPQFLQQAVTYTTYPGVLRDARRVGFVRLRDEQLAENLRVKKGAQWSALRVLATATGGKGPFWIDQARDCVPVRDLRALS